MTLSLPMIAMAAVIVLLGAGFYGLLISRNMIKVVVALQILAKGAILMIALAGRVNGLVDIGQSMALTVIVADTIVAVLGLALAVQIRRRFGTLDIKCLTNLRR